MTSVSSSWHGLYIKTSTRSGSGSTQLDGACAEAVHVNKPATPTVLVTTIKALLAGRQIAN
jgi:hypothetical protein